MFGKLEWVGDLDASREGRVHDDALAAEAAEP